jgi:hypothetical protein
MKTTKMRASIRASRPRAPGAIEREAEPDAGGRLALRRRVLQADLDERAGAASVVRRGTELHQLRPVRRSLQGLQARPIALQALAARRALFGRL